MAAMNIVPESGPDEDEGPPPAIALAKEALLEEVKKKLSSTGQKKAVSLVIIGKFDKLLRTILSCLTSVQVMLTPENRHSWVDCYTTLGNLRRRRRWRTKGLVLKWGKVVSVGPGAWTV